MAKQRNIVDFHSHQKSAQVMPKLTLPQLVISAQRRSKHYLKLLLPKFFSQADDSLFNLAEKAENNQEQTLYFDAMRELRLQQEAMQKNCLKAFEEGFHTALLPQKNAPVSTQSMDGISLIGDEQLEVSLAISNMANNADSLFRDDLHGLTARLDFLIEDIEITKTNNPLRPEVFCQAFVDAAECMSTDIKIKLVIYKLFDKFVAQQLGDMYQEINADLITAGVLPRIKSTIIKSESEVMVRNPAASSSYDAKSERINDQAPGSSARPVDEAQISSLSPDTDLFSALQELLHSQRLAPSATTRVNQETSTTHIDGENNVYPVDAENLHYRSEDVLSALTQLQTNSDLSSGDGQTQSIKALLTESLSHQDHASDNREIGQTQTDTIDIVSMLFDFILNDPGLSTPIKAQISRLQVPLIKVAIQDKSFFSQKTHPARQLLNELAYASNSLEDSEIQNDAVYKKVGYVVERILNEYEQDNEIFAILLKEFCEFVDKERETNRMAEEMLLEARNSVAQEIELRISNHHLAPLVNHILITSWKDVLLHIYLRDGKESTSWITALQVADDLIWSARPKFLITERQQLIKVIPKVLNGLRDGLTLIRYDHDASEKLFSGLEDLHLSSLRGGPSGGTVHHQQATTQSDHNKEKQWLSEEDFGIDISTLPEENKTSVDDELMEEIILSSSQPWDEAPVNSAMEAELKEMELSTWVEFIDPETERRQRGKLAWKCDFTGDYTFVDRKYKVVADLTCRQLAEEFELGRARIIEDVPLFDRALDSVFSGIKQALNRNSDNTH